MDLDILIMISSRLKNLYFCLSGISVVLNLTPNPGVDPWFSPDLLPEVLDNLGVRERDLCHFFGISFLLSSSGASLF